MTMSWEFRSRRLLAAAVSAAMLTTALSSAPALAQKTKDKTPDTGAEATATASPVETEISIEIPTVEAQNSTLEADAIRDILMGDIANYAGELATLDADSIVIPTVTMTYTTPESTGEVVYSDLELTDVADGIAASVSVGGFTFNDASEGAVGDFGPMTANDFNIGALLGFYGLAEDPGTEFKTVYRNFAFTGGTIESADMNCTIGAIAGEEFSARPLGTSFSDLMSLAAEMEAAGDDVPPELMSQFWSIYADFLTAFRSSPMTFDGIDCTGTTEEGAPMTVAIGSMTLGGFEPGTYPSITMEGFDVAVESGPEAGNFTLDQVVFKSFDFSEQLDALKSIPADAGEAWYQENYRSLIPAFQGFSFSGLSFDIPDPEGEGTISASVDQFDLSLSNYINGIPSTIETSASNVVVDIPEASEDETVQQLIAAGITSLDLGFNLSIDWDEATETIALNALTLEGAELGSVTLTGTFGNAVADLFSTSTDVATVASMGVTVEELTLDVNDSGIVEILLTQAGKEQGADAATMRPMMAGVAEGMAMGLLGGGEQAAKVGAAIGTFLRGGESLTINVTAKDEDGIGLVEFMAAQEDPTTLLEEVNVDATAQ
jgi:hypothetical protein